ncbi:Nucleoside diphosphate-linked moiety X motif 17 [Madurella fahalii]|uniref:Nucleoside diphosphate-linked moiety X motif 17 n=1 Tax=Madurella fahalii TaxID=1157608 RepID=A0ABQ0GPD0_9PEZI
MIEMKQQWLAGLTILGLTVLGASGGSIKMSCSQLVLDRIDPLVNPGVFGTSHLHQIVGGNSFNATMDPNTDPAERSTCTTCTFADDLSNYWTAVMYFRARNGTYKRVKQLGALFHEEARDGGMTIYYAPAKEPRPTVAFRKGFRMRSGDPASRTAGEHAGIDYTCLLRDDTRFTNISFGFPANMCPEGILTTIFFPDCWDGVHLDTPDHRSHVAFSKNNRTERAWFELGDCPPSHPVHIPKVFMETRWDTREFNRPELWPEDGSQPFVWSFGDRVGYGHHADYIFGWRGDSLQKALDRPRCGDQICELALQTIPEANKCMKEPEVKEEIDGWLDKLPGGVVAEA